LNKYSNELFAFETIACEWEEIKTRQKVEPCAHGAAVTVLTKGRKGKEDEPDSKNQRLVSISILIIFCYSLTKLSTGFISSEVRMRKV